MTEQGTAYGWGFRIEGVGEEGADASQDQQQILLGTDAFRGHETLVDLDLNYTVWPHVLHRSIGNPDRSIEFFQANNRWSTIRVQLEGVDRTVLRFTQRPSNADGVLDADLADAPPASEPTVDTDISGSLENSVIYIDQETIKLGSETGTPGTYDVHTRGAFGSLRSKHTAGSNVFTSTPDWRGRKITLASYEHSGGPDLTDGGTAAASFREVDRWTGRIGDKATLDKGQLTIPTKEVANAYTRVLAGAEERKPDRIQVVLKKEPARVRGGSGQVAIWSDSDIDYDPKIVKQDALGTQDEYPAALQIGEQVVPANQGSGTLTGDGVTVAGVARGGVSPLNSAEFAEELFERGVGLSGPVATIDETDQVYEVMAFDRLRSEKKVSPLGPLATSSALGSSERYAFHILALYGAVHLSTPNDTAAPSEFDVLQDSWSLGLKDQYTSTIVSDLEELIDLTPWAQIDRAVLGYSGEAVEIRKRVLEWMRGAGFKEGVNNQGELFVFREGTIDRSQLDTARGNRISMQNPSDELIEESGSSKTSDVLNVTIGKTPITEGRQTRYTAKSASDQSIRSGQIQQQADQTLNLNWISTGRESEVLEQVVSRLLIQQGQIPRVTGRYEDFETSGDDYGVGKLAQLDDPPVEPAWIYSRDGERVRSTGESEKFVGRITRNKLHVIDKSAAGAYTLRMVLLPVAGRDRAPSGVVDSVATTGGKHVITLKGGADNTVFGDTDADASRFTPGDDLSVFNQDGTPQANISGEIQEVDSVDAGANEVTLKGTYSADPDSGSVLELAHIETDGSGGGYQNDGLNGAFTHTDRLYVFFAESDETLGSEDVPADEYGG